MGQPREHSFEYKRATIFYEDRVPVETDMSGTPEGPFRWEVVVDGRRLGAATTSNEARSLVDALGR